MGAVQIRFAVRVLVLLLVPVLARAAVLEEVIVTAQKREQSLQSVGISVTAYTGKQLQQLGFTNAQEVSFLAPGVSTIQPNGPSNYAFAIRGVAQNDFISNQESPVSLYVDGVYVSQMSAAGFLLFDTDRVEILRGPQGTLFGRNATGGLVQYISNKPTDELSGYAKATFGSYTQANFEGAIGGPITNNIDGRLSVATNHNAGWIKNINPNHPQDINNDNDYATRGQLLFKLNDNATLLLNGHGSVEQIRTGFWIDMPSVTDSTGVLGLNNPNGVDFGGYNGLKDTHGNVFAGNWDNPGHQDLTTYGGSATLTWDFDKFTLTSISAGEHVDRDYTEDSDGSPTPSFNFYQVTNADQLSEEMRLNGQTDRTRWVAGFYYLNLDIHDANGGEEPLYTLVGIDPVDFPLVDASGNFEGVDNPYHTKLDTWSVFGQLEYDFTPKWTGIVGIRGINEDKRHHYENNFVDFIPGTRYRNGNPNILGNVATYDGHQSGWLWSAKVELDFHATDDLLLYASWNRGVKGGGFNAPLDLTGLTANDALMSFTPETLYSYEGGFKATLFGGTTRLNGSGFYYDYRNYQAFRIVGLSTFIFNHNANSHGFELELQSSPLEGLDMLLGAGYADVTIPNVDLGIGLGPENTVPVQSPKWNIDGLLRYEWPAWFGGDFALQGDFDYRSKHYFSLTKAQASTQPGYVVTNFKASYVSPDKHWTTTFFINNALDERYLIMTFDLATVLGMTEQEYGRPRWFGGSIEYNF